MNRIICGFVLSLFMFPALAFSQDAAYELDDVEFRFSSVKYYVQQYCFHDFPSDDIIFNERKNNRADILKLREFVVAANKRPDIERYNALILDSSQCFVKSREKSVRYGLYGEQKENEDIHKYLILADEKALVNARKAIYSARFDVIFWCDSSWDDEYLMRKKTWAIQDMIKAKRAVEELVRVEKDKNVVRTLAVDPYNDVILRALCAATGTSWVNETYYLLQDPTPFLVID
ncbi:hypothetical protein ACFL6Y_02045 [Elusimicrobiota bacterium]